MRGTFLPQAFEFAMQAPVVFLLRPRDTCHCPHPALAGVMALRIHCVNLQHALGQTQSNSRYLHDERSFAVGITTCPLWHEFPAV